MPGWILGWIYGFWSLKVKEKFENNSSFWTVEFSPRVILFPQSQNCFQTIISQCQERKEDIDKWEAMRQSFSKRIWQIVLHRVHEIPFCFAFSSHITCNNKLQKISLCHSSRAFFLLCYSFVVSASSRALEHKSAQCEATREKCCVKRQSKYHF